jgi:peroxiredoxin
MLDGGSPNMKTILRIIPCAMALGACVLASCAARGDGPAVPILAIGAPAPDFCLPGTDGQTHCLKDYSQNRVLVLAFTCNHCPTAQLYEQRLRQLAADYKDKGVALVAIEPNNPNAVRFDEMGYTDVGDSLEDMKTRAAYRQFNFPYLYDGETQSVSRAYGPSATPHLFIFDAQRNLRYQGRVDNNPREPLVTVRDARDAIDAILAGKPVAVPKTPSVGCSTKWIYKEEGRKQELAEIEGKPVTVDPVDAAALHALRKNTTNKLVLVNFWATWCAPCVQELPEIQTMYRMYGHRAFQVVTVSINYPDEKDAALTALAKLHATTRNFILGSTDIYPLLAAFDSDWNAAVPYSMLIRPGGEVVYGHQGTIDPLQMRRLIIANLPDDGYKGHQSYWQSAAK